MSIAAQTDLFDLFKTFTTLADQAGVDRVHYDAIRASLTDEADIEHTFMEQLPGQDSQTVCWCAVDRVSSGG